MPWALPLVGIDVLLVVLWTIAAALAIALIMTKVGNAFNSVPVVGKYIAGATKSVAHAITNACGALMSGIEQFVGAGEHLLARYLDQLFGQFLRHATLIAHLADLVGKGLYSVSGLRALVHGGQRAIHYLGGQVGHLVREYHGIERRLRTIEHDLAHGIGADVLPRIKSLDRELHKVEHKVIPALEADVAAAENDVGALRRWITDNIPLPGTSVFTGAIAVALGLLGLGGLRCSSLLNSLKNRGCGLWSGLEDLLGLFLDAIIVADLCTMLPELERLFAELEAPLVDLIASAADAACAQPASGWVELAAPSLSLPTVYYTGTPPGT